MERSRRIGRVRGRVAWAATALLAGPGCGQPRRWAIVNITDQKTTLLQQPAPSHGPQLRLLTAVLEHEPQAVAGQMVDYMTTATLVDCRARTYQLGTTTAFDAGGRQLAAEPGADPPTPIRPGSNEAAEADAACTGATRLPAARPGDLPALLHDFRTGSVLPGVRLGG